MTISLDERRRQQREVLIALVNDVGDDCVMGHMAAANESSFACIGGATWDELKGRGLVEQVPVFGQPTYKLTYAGWRKGIRLRGDIETDAFRTKCITLVQALKRIVGKEGRESHHDEMADERELAPELQLPAGWIWNVLQSGSLSDVVKDKRMDVYYDHKYRCFRVKPTFGMPIDTESL